MHRWFLITVIILTGFLSTGAQISSTGNPDKIIITENYSKTVFPLVLGKKTADLYTEADDYEVVKIAADDLQNDIYEVSGIKPKMIQQLPSGPGPVVIIGTIGKCKILDILSMQKKIDLQDIRDQWETFSIAVVEDPFPGINKALLIVGSDRRGTAFGVYELSRQIGVSPWHFWADVPVKKKKNIFVKEGHYQFGPPSVKYRGIFINDSGYGLRPWSRQARDPKTGKKLNTRRLIYKLMLRLKANYTWNGGGEPADSLAIVLGTSHNSQMNAGGWNEQEQGVWQYDINRENIYNHWKRAVEKKGRFEGVYTLGMRDRLDLPMQGDNTIDQRVSLLEKIFKDQREILSNTLKKPIEQIPQIFAPYKEVLGLYDQGLKVPDDITIVWPDDNYGYIKRLPDPREQARSGGSGVYYHLSYLGRPHDYLWLSSHNPVHIWTEMKKAWDFNARRLWVFNVGDIKPAEYNLSFVMDLAWDITAFNRNNIREHLESWLANIFGEQYAREITDIQYVYYQLAFQRKPEFMGWDRLEPTTPVVDTEFSSIHYREAECRLNKSKQIKQRADAVFHSLPEHQMPAFYQLVWYPVACQYYTDAKLLYAQTNRLYAKQGRASTNHYAELAAAYWDSIKTATKNYHNLLDGKWMDIIQWNGIGINPPKYWLPVSQDNNLLIENQPNYFMPPVEKNEPATEASMGIFAEGFEEKVLIDGHAMLPWFDNIYKQSHFFEIFNKGLKPFEYKITVSDDWIVPGITQGTCVNDSRIMVNIDYNKLADKDTKEHSGYITISGAGSTRKIDVFVFTPSVTAKDLADLFVETAGAVSINAENFHRKKDGRGFGWEITRDMGHTGNMIGAYPFTTEPVEQEWDVEHDRKGAFVEYDFYCFNSGWVNIYSYCLPTFPENTQRHSVYGISVDDGPPLIIDFATKLRDEKWKQNVQRNQSVNMTKHFIKNSGRHTLKIWMIDTGVFIDKIVMDFGGLRDSYMGPEQTKVVN